MSLFKNQAEMEQEIRTLLSELSNVSSTCDARILVTVSDLVKCLRMNGFRFVYVGGEASGNNSRNMANDVESAIHQITQRGAGQQLAESLLQSIFPHIVDINKLGPVKYQLAAELWRGDSQC